jgi:hypothetical protein
LQISAGADAWENYTFVHSDYFAATQPALNNELLDPCLRNAPYNVLFANSRCGAPPGR